jgi:hypothetical protein
MPTVSTITLKVSFPLQGTNKPHKGGTVGKQYQTLVGFSIFSLLDSTGRSKGTAGITQKYAPDSRNSKGFQSWGVNRAPRTFSEAVYLVLGVKGEPLVVRSYGDKGGTKKADKSGATKITSRRYSFYAVSTYFGLFTPLEDKARQLPNDPLAVLCPEKRNERRLK